MGHFRARALACVCAAGLALALAAMTASAQAAVAPAAARQPEVPFVSRLAAAGSAGGVTLTWKDSPDVVGTCLVYRSSIPITAATIGSANLAGSVASGVESFKDAPPDQGAYYYAVIMQDASGTRYPLAVPYRNVTTAAVAAGGPAPAAAAPSPASTSAAAPAAAAAQTPAPVAAASPAAVSPAPASARTAAPVASSPDASTPAQITGIAAAVSAGGDSVTITFQSSNASRDLLLFAGNAPLASSIDLLKSTATVPLDPGMTRYLLAALPDTSYWFAVLDAGLYKIGQVPLVQGLNATASPVRVPPRTAGATAEAVAARRAQPLPALDPGFGVQSGVDLGDSDAPVLPAVKQVSAVTSKAITWLLNAAGQQTPAPQSPALLEGDTAAGSGETGQLLAIVRGPFRQNNMNATEKQLLDFLSLPRAPQLEAHARFYLGQSYFFEGKTREALLEFLQAEDTYYLPVQPWINASLDTLEAQDR